MAYSLPHVVVGPGSLDAGLSSLSKGFKYPHISVSKFDLFKIDMYVVAIPLKWLVWLRFVFDHVKLSLLDLF